jgi:uncharacterized protein YjbI with pentapeptide repeats
MRRIRERWLLLLLTVGILVVLLLLVVAVLEPPWMLGTKGLAGAELAKARNDFRGTLVTAILGGLALIIGAVVGAQSLRESGRQNQRADMWNRETLELQRRGQVADRFTKAIEQLGEADENKLDIRLGGAYALEQIARDSPELHWPIVEILTAFVREHTNPSARALPTSEERDQTGASNPRPPTAAERQPLGVTADIQAALTVLGRRHASNDLGRIDLSEAKLTGAVLRGANLQEADLGQADLQGAYLSRADLQKADLVGANLQAAYLGRANLRSAGLWNANLKGAYLIEADLQGALLVGANLEGADLQGTNLEGADLREANFAGANLGGAHLEGANLERAHLRGAYLDEADLEHVDLAHVVGLTWAALQPAKNVDKSRLPVELWREADNVDIAKN